MMMDANLIRAKGRKVKKGRKAGHIWAYNGGLWLIMDDKPVAFFYGHMLNKR